jgi:hypothetical protein
MNSAVKAACLSGLVYPGLGQIVQKHYVRGIALIGVVTGSLLMLVFAASRHVSRILAEVQSSGGDYDVATIVKKAADFSASPESGLVKIASALLLCGWIIGIVDAYLSGSTGGTR